MQAIKVICDTNIISNYLGEKGDIKVKQEVLKLVLKIFYRPEKVIQDLTNSY